VAAVVPFLAKKDLNHQNFGSSGMADYGLVVFFGEVTHVGTVLLIFSLEDPFDMRLSKMSNMISMGRWYSR